MDLIQKILRIQKKHEGSTSKNNTTLHILSLLPPQDTQKILQYIDEERVMERYGHKRITITEILESVYWVPNLTRTGKNVLQSEGYCSPTYFIEEREADLKQAKERGLI